MTVSVDSVNESAGTMRDVKVLAKGAGISLVGKLGSRALQLLIQVMLARWLGLAGFGLFSIGQNVFQIVSQLGVIGLPTGVIRFGVPAHQAGERELAGVLRNTFLAALLSGLVFGGASFLLAPWLAVRVFRQVELASVLRGFALVSTVVIWQTVIAAATRVSKRMEYSTIMQDILPFGLTLALVAVMAFALDLTVQGAVWALALSNVLATALGLVFVMRLYPHFRLFGEIHFDGLKTLMSYSLASMLAAIFNLWLPTVSVLALGYYGALNDVAIFQAAEQIAMLSAIVLLAFTVIFSPMIAGLYEKKEMRQLNALFKISTKWGLYVSLPLLLVVALLPQQIMQVLYGPEYAAGGNLLVILIFAQLINTMTGAVGPMLSMTHHQTQLLWRVVFAFVLCVVGNFLLIPRWGTVGAAIALGASITLLNLLMLFDVRRLLKLWPYDRRYYKMFVALLITAPVSYWSSRLLSAPSILTLAAVTLISVGLFGSTLWLLRLEAYEREVISSILGRLKIKV